jgi:hypothetical protein
MAYPTNLSNDLIKPTHQLSEIMKSITQLSLAASLPASTRAWTQELTALTFLRLTLPPETQQPLANLGQQLRQALAPLAHIGAVWQQVMGPLIPIDQQAARLFQEIYAPKQPTSLDGNHLIARTLPLPGELRESFHQHKQASQVWHRQLVADMEAHPDFYADLEDLLTLIRFEAEPDAGHPLGVRDAAIHRLVTRLSLGLADRAANAALRRMTRECATPRQALLRKWLFPAGILLAAATMFEPRYIRLGKCWVKGTSRRKLSIAPVHLLPFEARHWLFQEVRNAARRFC